jgi:phosphatidylinositol glycan class V
MMLSSAWRAVKGETDIKVTASKVIRKSSSTLVSDERRQSLVDTLLFRLALPQLALASAALMSFHVQVITRLSSGYPLWYLVLAQDIMYAIIQTPLYAYFLPPA